MRQVATSFFARPTSASFHFFQHHHSTNSQEQQPNLPLRWAVLPGLTAQTGLFTALLLSHWGLEPSLWAWLARSIAHQANVLPGAASWTPPGIMAHARQRTPERAAEWMSSSGSRGRQGGRRGYPSGGRLVPSHCTFKQPYPTFMNSFPYLPFSISLFNQNLADYK